MYNWDNRHNNIKNSVVSSQWKVIHQLGTKIKPLYGETTVKPAINNNYLLPMSYSVIHNIRIWTSRCVPIIKSTYKYHLHNNNNIIIIQYTLSYYIIYLYIIYCYIGQRIRRSLLNHKWRLSLWFIIRTYYIIINTRYKLGYKVG